jgi:catechol-2,3-dioxygenase
MDSSFFSQRLTAISAIAPSALLQCHSTSLAAEANDQPFYSRDVVELGIVVADLEKSATFYANVLGIEKQGAKSGSELK